MKRWVLFFIALSFKEEQLFWSLLSNYMYKIDTQQALYSYAHAASKFWRKVQHALLTFKTKLLRELSLGDSATSYHKGSYSGFPAQELI